MGLLGKGEMEKLFDQSGRAREAGTHGKKDTLGKGHKRKTT